MGQPSRPRVSCAPRVTCALLAPRTALAVADSAYNEAHLVAAGFSATAVVPPSAALDDRHRRRGAPGATAGAARSSARGARWLAVGRVSPNKALESTVAALAVARAHGDPTPRSGDRKARHRLLRRRAPALRGRPGPGRRGQVRRPCSDATVAAAYAEADVLVVTSEHEGFCVPVVEAMTAGLPVVAFDQGAVPEVLGGAPYSSRTRTPTPWPLHRRAAGGTAPAGRGRRRRAPAGWPTSTSTPRPTASSACCPLVGAVASAT